MKFLKKTFVFTLLSLIAVSAYSATVGLETKVINNTRNTKIEVRHGDHTFSLKPTQSRSFDRETVAYVGKFYTKTYTIEIKNNKSGAKICKVDATVKTKYHILQGAEGFLEKYKVYNDDSTFDYCSAKITQDEVQASEGKLSFIITVKNKN